MPRKDGLNVIKDIRKQDPENTTPIIILTNSKDSQYLASALSHQVTSYLVKADHSLDDIVKRLENNCHNSTYSVLSIVYRHITAMKSCVFTRYV